MRNNLSTKGTVSVFFLLLLVSLGTPFLQAQAQLTPSCGFDGSRDINKDGKINASDANEKYVSGDPEWEGCKLCDFFVLGNNVLKFLFLTLVPIGAVIMFVVGGFMFLVSAGNPGQLDQGKQIIKTTVIGLIIIYGAWLAVDFFFVAIGVANWTGLQGGWFIINCPVP